MKFRDFTNTLVKPGGNLNRTLPPLFWLILGTAVLLRIPNLSESLWLDELWSTRYYLGDLQQLKEQILVRTHPPLHFLSMYVWIQLFGDSAISIRLPFLLFGIGSLVLTYLLACKLTARAVALLAIFFLALSPVHIWYSQESRPYMALAFFLLLCLYSIQKLATSDRRLLWQVVYFGSLISLLLLHYYSCFLLIPLSLRCLLQSNPTKRITFILTLLAAFLFAVFMFVKIRFGSFDTGVGFLRQFNLFEFWMLCFQWFGLGNSVLTIGPYNAARKGFQLLVEKPRYLAIHCILLLLLLKGMWHMMRHAERDGSRTLLSSFLIIPIVLMILSALGWKNIYIERSLFCILPIYAVFLAQGVFAIQSFIVRRSAIVITCTLSIAALVGYYLDTDEWTVYKPNPNWAAAATQIVESSSAGIKHPLVLCATLSDVLRYYEPQIQLSCAGDAQPELFELKHSEAQEFFLVHNKYDSGEFQELLKSASSASQFRLVKKKSFKGMEVYQFSQDFTNRRIE